MGEMKVAEQETLKYIQGQSFGMTGVATEESSMNAKATRKGFVKKSSSVRSLDSVITDGLLRVGGRPRRAKLEVNAKRQNILPKCHQVVDLIVRHYHLISGHSGQEYVLSLRRERFSIIKARVSVRRILRNFFDCKRRQKPPGHQKMADLPTDRVTPHKPPFAFARVDCFGPYLVKRGRSMVKRDSIMFTCLAVRSILKLSGAWIQIRS